MRTSRQKCNSLEIARASQEIALARIVRQGCVRRLSTRSWRAARNFTVEVAGPACVVTEPWHIGHNFARCSTQRTPQMPPPPFCLPPPPRPPASTSSRRHHRLAYKVARPPLGRPRRWPEYALSDAGCRRPHAHARWHGTARGARGDAGGRRRRALCDRRGGAVRVVSVARPLRLFDPHAASVLAGLGEHGWRQQLASCYTSSINALVERARGDGPVAVARHRSSARARRARRRTRPRRLPPTRSRSSAGASSSGPSP